MAFDIYVKNNNNVIRSQSCPGDRRRYSHLRLWNIINVRCNEPWGSANSKDRVSNFKFPKKAGKCWEPVWLLVAAQRLFFFSILWAVPSRRAHVANNLKMKPIYLLVQFNGNVHHHNIGRLYLSLDETFPHHHQSGWRLSAGVHHGPQAQS